MDFRRKVWCASPKCKGKCGRKLTDHEEGLARALGEDHYMDYAYFCGAPDFMNNFDRVKAKFQAALIRLRER